MFRHVALFVWNEGVTAEQVARVGEALAALPEVVPSLCSYRFGPDAGLADGNFDYAVVADFEDESGFRVYRDHPEHQRVLRDVIAPLLARRAAAQYDAGR